MHSQAQLKPSLSPALVRLIFQPAVNRSFFFLSFFRRIPPSICLIIKMATTLLPPLGRGKLIYFGASHKQQHRHERFVVSSTASRKLIVIVQK